MDRLNELIGLMEKMRSETARRRRWTELLLARLGNLQGAAVRQIMSCEAHERNLTEKIAEERRMAALARAAAEAAAPPETPPPETEPPAGS